jgi:hypothetical protein
MINFVDGDIPRVYSKLMGADITILVSKLLKYGEVFRWDMPWMCKLVYLTKTAVSPETLVWKDVTWAAILTSFSVFHRLEVGTRQQFPSWFQWAFWSTRILFYCLSCKYLRCTWLPAQSLNKNYHVNQTSISISKRVISDGSTREDRWDGRVFQPRE